MQKSLCNTCLHYFGDLECTAFPKGIPNEILTGTNDHEKPLKKQGNFFVYEPR